MDTKYLESIAEEYISYRLQHAGILVAKPKFDREGTDLLAFVRMGDGVKFCRIQCKGRSIVRSRSAINVPKSYVTRGFVLALHLDFGMKQVTYLFFAADVRRWKVNSRGEFQLSLAAGNAEEKLGAYVFDDEKINILRSVIEAAEVTREYAQLVRGKGAPRSTLAVTSKGLGTVRGKKAA